MILRPDSSNLFDDSQQLDGGNDYPNQMTSTLYKPQDLTGKEKAVENGESQEVSQITVPKVADETMWEKSPELSPLLHERRQSFNFCQTVFYFMANSRTFNITGQRNHHILN